MDCRVVLEAAVTVYDVETPDEAVRIAIAETGRMLNPDLSYVDIETGTRTSPRGEALPPAFVAAGEALVALELEMTVFDVEDEEHASRIARSEIGRRLDGIPLEVVERTSVSEGSDAEESSEPADGDANGDADHVDGETESEDGGGTGDHESLGGEGDDETGLLPEFEEMVDENRR